MTDSPSTVPALLGVAVALAVGLLSVVASVPPAPRDAGSPPTGFSAERARDIVEEIARRPRPLGSEAHDQVLEVLRARLEALGLETAIERSTVVHPRGGRVLGARVANLTARRSGRGRAGAILLMAHYDSVPGSPGAGDDASGVAALLETARALTAAEPLEREVRILLTDGEEAGLLGARAFVEDRTRLAEIALVLNFEARGSGGPVLMFETGPGNRGLAELLARHAPRPVASSLSYEVYRRMPNDTDFTVLRRAGLRGFNFAMIGDHGSYHTRLDTPAGLEMGSLQQQGDYALALTRVLGGLEELPPPAADGVFFNAFGSHLFVSYSSDFGRLLATLLVPLAGLALTLCSRRHRGRLTGAGWGVLFFVSAAIGGVAAATVVWRLAGALAPEMERAPHGVPWIGGWLVAAGLLMTAGLLAGLALLLLRLAEPLDLWAGALVGWSLAALATALFVPGAGYLFLWPAVFGWLALLAADPASPAGTGVLPASLAAALSAALLAPVVRLLISALTVRQAGPGLALAALGGTLLAPPLVRIAARFGNWTAVLPVTGAVVVLAVPALVWVPGPDEPATDHLLYALDGNRGRAYWMSGDERPAAWAEELFREPESGRPPAPLDLLGDDLLWAPAPRVDFDGPAVTEEIGETAPRDDVLRLRLRSRRSAPALRFRLRSAEDFRLRRLDGRPVPKRSGKGGEDPEIEGLFLAPPPEGVVLAIEPRPSRLTVEVADQSYGFPPATASRLNRPDRWMARPGWTGDSTFVIRCVELSGHPGEEAAAGEGGDD